MSLNPEWISASAAVVASSVTVVYVVFTYRALRVSEKALAVSQAMVKISHDQIRAQTRPYIQINAAPRPGNQIFQLIIMNSGQSAALSLKLDLAPEFRQFHDKNKKPLQELALFKDSIQSFPPGAKIIFDLGVGYQFFQGNENDQVSPPKFSVTASYRDCDASYVETTNIDLNLFHQSTASKYGKLGELHEIKDELRSISSSFRELVRARADS